MILIYVVCRDEAQADVISRTLLERRLAACTNSWPIASRYWWQGSLVEDRGFVLLVKTSDSNYSAVEQAIRHMHTYEVPAIIGLPVKQAFGPYVDWIEAETQ